MRGRKLLFVRGYLAADVPEIKKESPNEGTETMQTLAIISIRNFIE